MKHYKKLLLELQENGWELVERDDDCEWWLEEARKILRKADSTSGCES
jgi:hypothetical protein